MAMPNTNILTNLYNTNIVGRIKGEKRKKFYPNDRKRTAIDITKIGKTPSSIIDITKIPDVAQWSKEVTSGSVTNVGMPITQGIVSIEKSSSAIGNTIKTKKADIDPANPEEMSSVINSDLSLTDKTKPFSTVLDKLSSGTSKMRTDKNKTINSMAPKSRMLSFIIRHQKVNRKMY